MTETELFWLRVVLSFVVGGIWLMLVSVLTEKKGTKLGGLLGGLPSTVLVALLFIGLDQGAYFAADAAVSTIIPFIINPFFLWLLASLVHKGFAYAMSIAAMVWLLMIAVVHALHPTNIWVNIVVWFIGMAILIFGHSRILPVSEVKGSKVKFTKAQLAGRALFAGTIIASAVVAGKYSGSVLGGILAAFPAGFVSSFTIIYFARGTEFVRSFSRMLMLSGATNPAVYSVAVYFLYPTIGLWWGTVVAFAISLISMQYVVAPLSQRLNK